MHTTVANEDHNFGCPILDANGALVGFVQQNVEKKDSTSCAIDANFLNKLHISSMSVLNSDLRQILIPKALPSEEKEALTYLAMMNATDSVAAATSYNDFITATQKMPKAMLHAPNFMPPNKTSPAATLILRLLEAGRQRKVNDESRRSS